MGSLDTTTVGGVMVLPATDVGGFREVSERSASTSGEGSRQDSPSGASKPPAGVPEVLAVIDIGSNAIRMVIAQILPSGELEILERLWRAVRLGQDTFRTGRLRAETMRTAISILRDYRSLLNTYGAGRIRAVATTALREASNGDTFVDRILMATGLEVSVISVAEEGRLVVSAVRQIAGDSLLKQGDVLVVEVSGGGTVMNLLHDGQITASQNMPIGSVRMQESLSTSTLTADRAARLIRQQVAGSISTFKDMLPLRNVQNLIVVGGDARWAAAQLGRAPDDTGLRGVTKEALDGWLSARQNCAAEELARTYGLPFIDAETIVPALLVYQALLKATAVKEMIVAGVSMRDGILRDMMTDTTGRRADSLYREVLQSARAIGQKYHTDAAHAEHTRLLAAHLFDELAAEHRLGAHHRLLLEVAALLHEIGAFVSSRARHKHSCYLIMNSDILGLNQDELVMVANIARYHRRSRPEPSHMEYMSMSREQRMIVSKLAAILRIADALDVSRTQQIKDFKCRIGNNGLTLTLEGNPDLIMERRSLAEKADMFVDIYGLDVHLEAMG
jgi:exopolyphosphatase/guanosine-5'-triphosphate,3'-diphosphate pyrophosphatase